MSLKTKDFPNYGGSKYVARNFVTDLKHSVREGTKEEWLERHKEYFNDKRLYIISDSDNATSNDRGKDMVVYSPKRGRIYHIEHKEHFNMNYNDDLIHLEYLNRYSNGKDKPGWIEDNDKETEVLSYYKHSTDTVYYFDWIMLRKVWDKHKEEWLKEYRVSKTKNIGFGGTTYHTYCLGVPASVIYEAIEAIKEQEE